MSLLQKKIANPLNFYTSPHQVDEDTDLSVEEKVKILTSWLNDIELRQTAENENMRDTKNLSRNGVALIERLLRKYKDDIDE